MRERSENGTLTRGADGDLYLLTPQSCVRVGDGGGVAFGRRSIDRKGADCTQPVAPADHLSARMLVDPGDQLSARMLVDPGDGDAARMLINPGDELSARMLVDPGDGDSGRMLIEPGQGLAN